MPATLVLHSAHKRRSCLSLSSEFYPPIACIPSGRRFPLQQSLEQRQSRIKAELEALPDVDLEEVPEFTNMSELAKTWQMANTGGYYVAHPISWERASVASGNWRSDMERKLTEAQAHRLREMLLKLNCRITIKNHAVFISGRVSLAGVRVKQAAS